MVRHSQTGDAQLFAVKRTRETISQKLTLTDASRRGQEKPPGATHRFYIVINRTGYFVSRYANRYEVEPAEQTQEQQREEALREAVLDTALAYLIGARYRPGRSSQEDKEN